MSRDWRPIEFFIADKNLAETGKPLRDAVITFKSIIEGGEGISIPLTNEKAREAYPELSFLMDGFDAMYEKNHSKEACKVYDAFEKALKQAEDDYEEIKSSPEDKELYLLDETDLAKQTIDMVTEEWFYGRLDSNFYYSEQNNEAMKSFLQDKVNKEKQKNRGIERE